MNIERLIASVINLPSVPCFGICGNILTVSHNTPICTIFYSTSIINCGNVYDLRYFTFAVYDTSLCCTFSCFGPPYAPFPGKKRGHGFFLHNFNKCRHMSVIFSTNHREDSFY